jgi:hypothetical protein
MSRFLLFAAMGALAGCAANFGGPTPKKGGDSHDAGDPISEATLGLRFYPGACVVIGGVAEDVVSANLETGDAPEKVGTFYQAELGLTLDPSMRRLTGTKGGRHFVISIVPFGEGATISIIGKK